MALRTLVQASVSGKTVLVRADFNVPLQNGLVQDDTRLRETLPTLHWLLERGAKVVLMSHLGRPKGKVDPSFSLAPVAKRLGELLGLEVSFVTDCVGADVENKVKALANGGVLLLENLRFHAEEEMNEATFAKSLTAACDLFVNDAFGTLHRAHASTVGVTAYLPSYAGLLVQKEVEMLSKLLEAPEKPLTLIVGGAKIDTKIGILEKFLSTADVFIIGGALANTFLKAQGYEVGESLYEIEKVPVAQRFLAAAKDKKVLLPTDLVLADGSTVPVDQVPVHGKILDIGAQSLEVFTAAILGGHTVVWNGPMGLYEQALYENGTRLLAEAVAAAPGVKVIGGGDTIDAVNHFGIAHDKITHISTGGGAMLEFLEGKILPGVQVLLDK